MKIRWFDVLALAGLAAFIVVGAAMEWSFKTNYVPGIVASIVIPILTVSALVFIVIRRMQRWWIDRRWLDGIEMRTVDRMTGAEFEETCGEIFRRLGYRVEVTQQTRDQGADLLLNGREGRVVVQTKRQDGRVGNGAVQEIVAAKAFYGAVRAIVLTNNEFSKSAIALGKANGVDLMARRALAELLAKATRRATVSESGGKLVVPGLTSEQTSDDAH